MAHSITQFLIILAPIFMAFSPMSFAVQQELPASTISAAPALLPDPISPVSEPPALSPDITPLFPSPGGSALSPSDSSLPTIPSSPSPPNPDAMEASGPGAALEPMGTLPDSSTVRLSVQGFLNSIAVLCLVAFGFLASVSWW
ncbi:classical arabinogalactan protein 26-like [Henckelia pumila]|uniref:classical arabinogalactan protein 26-like n=1 Tax=Henckelia pumila TaxID=405737 RepID=UPI003C6DBDE0